ncbi:sensor histidine kinase [Pseudomonas sp. CFBP 13711]|uniref:sensor histidine kinase n=1 Tax=unclassified Pseudomonas TaxID=196821 RepID=UPI00177D0191|nr:MULTISPECIES: sensor histidine kinase [unclassified Pseudomonas]MBD8706887.1 sensor histidine kinase [Pseudomonas sp. CFBP 13711]MBD8712959.1 sensor histidine kinase [Pseudomonas sp. CFBP 13715]
MVEPRKRMPGRHSLFWKLAVLLVGFCLLMIWLSWYWGRYIETRNAYLNAEAHQVLNDYAAQAERAWNSGGQRGIDEWLKQVRLQETGWVGVIGSDLQSLGSTPLTREQSQRLTFMRGIDWPMSTRQKTVPWLKIAFPGNPGAGSLVIELPERFKPGRYAWVGQILTNVLIPALFTLLLCVGLYRLLIRPLNQLREQANAWRADRLSSRLSPQMTERRDELGELNRAFDHMAARLHSTVQVQQQLLRDLSHELRTPLSRLRVACDSEQTLPELRERLSREVDGMRRLVDDTLQLAWLDTEREKLPGEDIQVVALWEMLVDDACFETCWPSRQLRCDLDSECWVSGHLNTLAQALENILRNAIRHSPPEGIVRLDGRREGDDWLLWLEDLGGGIDEGDLERIFAPFIRLDGARPGDGGFGLGLSIARNSLRLQGGDLWAENTGQGLRMIMRLPARGTRPF